ncbi:MAG: tRNA pseudouridine(38-40) synthase TruA [Bacteroidales bacterium]|nr:tRNA pseudouridine(38-40) synthase TruA [Bacteroidales bacterium]
MRYALTLSYDGSSFCGWQIQPGDPSVQQTLQNALTTLLGKETAVTGAGRTDTGVNALGYVAHFDCDGSLPYKIEDFLYKINAILPKEIAVQSICEAESEFHARFDATRRTYHYFIHFEKDPFVRRTSWFCKYRLDVAAMRAACPLLLGTHDFSCFEKSGADSKTSICTVYEAEWKEYVPMLGALAGGDCPERSPAADGPEGSPAADGPEGSPAADGRYLYFRITADRFLRNMVRAIVGTMVEIGRGRMSPDDIPALLASHDRCRAGQSVPGHALFLTKVEY